MSRGSGFVLSTLVSIGLSTSALFGQHTGRSAPSGSRGGPVLGAPTGNTASGAGCCSTPFVNSYFYPTLGWYGGYFSPFLNLPGLAPNYNYAPNYWWTGPNSGTDPRQEGYNPSSGYPSETVSTLLLETFPAKARVILDGVFIGTADSLGPTQLPVGEHSLRVEAASYEPSETILKVEQPTLQQLEIRLNPIAHTTKPAPRP